ncbi:hypothetical protein KQ945_04340 [Bacillus subtilis subsp. subtilis]|nr:hypothetical protein [Bacillus subtilis subsp. subtilis]
MVCPLAGRRMMKNHYTLQALVRSELSSTAEEQRIFFLMQAVATASADFLPVADLDALADVLAEHTCYIAPHRVTRKGRTVIFSGRTYRATAVEVMAFLRGAAQAGDLRPLLIAPHFDTQPGQVVTVDEDQICLYRVG